MEYVNLANLKVSKLCFGSLTVSPLQAALPIDKGAEVIAHAFDHGVNFIDTAQYYDNYDYIREALRLSKLRPDDVVISSKTYAYDRKSAAAATEEARRSLDRDYIDIFMLHEQESIHTLRGHSEALDYLFEAREKGIIRAVGVSMHHIAAVRGVCELKKRGYPIDCVHPIYNKSGTGIADGTIDDMYEAIKTAHTLGIGIFAMKPLAGGHLYNDAAAAFDFLLDCEYIDSVAVGMQSTDEVDENIKYFETRTFDNLLRKHKRRLHIENYCEGCGNCVRRCAHGALKITAGKAVADTEKCILCGYCSAVCEIFAIKVL